MSNVVTPETTPEAARVESTDLFARILVPVDFSAGSRRALQLALELRRRFGSAVMLVNVAGPSDGDEFLGGTGAPWNARDISEEAEDELHRFVAHVAPGEEPVVACDVEMEGDLATAVCRAVERYGATLVILAKTERRRRPLFRTKSERIAASLCCAVMFVQCEREPDVIRD